ncbi:multidrug ABC transporter ATPase [Clostridium carboxidivorans P7]|uniref:ABC transporter ATP-binding protein n=1 Tax=Clostridium carboxidivorans TaxID=217159 RepID=UPI0001D38FE7|nr:ABC transporter ATP-binding protein [Clostridium carboxidivorans]AKN32075.1 multidrug ABC transporter ATPase [Clostridium carboxidivorans P7]EFG88993.1 ABC transporter, ATP-binding protein [Clostridium carboxidivorans P7]
MGGYNNLLKLNTYIKKCKFNFFAGIVGMIICSIMYTPVPYLMGYVIDKVLIPHKSYMELYKIIAVLILLHVLRYIISIFSKSLFIKVQNSVVNEVRVSMMDKIIDLPMSFLGKKEKGYILSRISECGNIGSLFSPMFVNTFLSIFDFIFALIMMITLSYKLTIIVIIIVPVYFFTVKHSSNQLSESTKLMLETGAVLSGETYEVLNGIEEIKILNGKKVQLKKFKNKLNEMVKSSIKQSKQILFFMENILLVNNLAAILILLFSGIFILNNQLTIGIYTAFIAYMNKIFATTSSFASLGMTVKPVCVSIERTQEFLEMNDENTEKCEIISENIDSISIENLRFKYEENGENIIDKLNFKMNKGDKVLIKGENGTGKSTLIKNLLGLYSPTEGEIYINDKKYSLIDKRSIRSKIGVVSQNVFLFRGSILDNILYGQTNKSKEDVVSLIKKYNLEKYIQGFENGLETEINQNGIGISGGQTQIIAFLRATIAKKDVIILDEGTSNMDAETRKIILKILGERDICNILMIISHQEDGMEFVNKTLCLKKPNDN